MKFGHGWSIDVLGMGMNIDKARSDDLPLKVITLPHGCSNCQ